MFSFVVRLLTLPLITKIISKNFKIKLLNLIHPSSNIHLIGSVLNVKGFLLFGIVLFSGIWIKYLFDCT